MAKIMLVEDDNNLREIYEARLMAEGYEIVSARDGEEAHAVAVREKPDLIISDVMMPKISGFDMLDILRSTPETKNTKVIMMTALSQAEDKERAEKLGADRYLVESQVTLEDVAKVAREVLAGDAVSASTPAAPDPAPAAAAPAPAPEPVATAVPAPPVPAAPTPPAAIPIAEETPTNLASTAVVQAPAVDSGVTDLAAPAPAATEVLAPAETPVIAPALRDDNDIEKTSAELWAAPAAETAAPAEATTDQTPVATPNTTAAEAKVDAAPSQSLADEEAAIAKQIESIIDNPPAAAAPAADPAPAATPAEAPVPPTEAPAPAAEPVAEAPAKEEEKPAQKTGGEKVIQPINDPAKAAGPSLDELVAKEAALEAKTGQVIAPQKSADGVDPNSLAL